MYSALHSCTSFLQKVCVRPGLHLWKVPTFHPQRQRVTSKIKRFHELRVEKWSWVQSSWSLATWRCSSKCLATKMLDKFLTQAWHPSWLGLEQCPSQFHYIPRPGNRANKLIGLGAPFRSCLPACGFSEWVMSFGARHSSLWKFDINNIVTLHLVKWVLMPFNNTATGAKGCQYGIVGWSLTSKTYSPSTDFEEHIHQYLPSKREVGVWNAPYFKPQQRAKKTQRWNAKEDKHLPESSSKCQVDTWDGS